MISFWAVRTALISGPGNDRLHGEAGNDTLTGSVGADHFVFSSRDGADCITDSTCTQSDQIFLDDVLWTCTRSAAQVVTSFSTVTAEGVLFNFGTIGTLLLQGVTSTTILAALIEIY
jgi:serralysin